MAGLLVNWWDAYQRHRPAIADMLDPRLYPIEWIDAQIWSGRFKTFASDNAIIAVEIKPYPSGVTEVHGMFAAGDLSEIMGLIEQAEEWGRSMGCAFAGISSRPGWAKVMAGKGYETDQVSIRKVL